ncbi:MAG: hypothetical protein V1845_02090 [bacterium]
MNERMFTLMEVEEAIIAAKAMVLGANTDAKTEIVKMGGYILSYLKERHRRPKTWFWFTKRKKSFH